MHRKYINSRRKAKVIMAGESVFAFVLLFINFAGCFLVPDGRISVHTPVGEIVGFSTNLRIKGTHRVVRKFLGIPYAEQPIGTRRFRKPVPKAIFNSSFDASNYGDSCFQFEGKRQHQEIYPILKIV